MSVAQRGTGADGLSGKMVWGLVAALVAAVLAPPAQAEDLKGRWYFGGHLGYLSTTDSIRSNSDIIIGPYGDDNIPFTGDPNEEQGCVGAISAQTYCDPRPDNLLARTTSIEETFKFDIDAGFGITSWLNLQIDASYFKGEVGPVDTILIDHFPISANPTNPGVLDRFKERAMLIPVQAGEITEIPVSLSAVARFRKDSPLNPYVGIGAGMIFANIDRSSDVDDLNTRMDEMRIRGIANEWHESILREKDRGDVFEGRIQSGRDNPKNFKHPLTVDVKNSYEWHLLAGAEYFFNDRLSLIFDARYVFADEYVELDLGGEDQINLATFSEAMFWEDGSTKIFAPTGVPPNTPCAETWNEAAGRYVGVGCNDLPEGYVAPGQQNCPASADFDGNGKVDKCYGANVIPWSPFSAQGKDPRGDLIVQGGRISLTGFAVAIGARFHF